MWNPDPRGNEKTGIVGEQMQVAHALLRAPPDKAVSASNMPCDRAPGKAGHRASIDKRQVLEVLSHRLHIAQIMELGNESVMQFFKFSAPHLAQYDRLNVLEVGLQRSLVDLHGCGRFAI